MKKALLGIFLVALILTLMAQIAPQKKFTYIGAKKCGKCHGSEAIGNQNKIWMASPHAKAVLILQTEQAFTIGKKAGVTAPDQDIKCLKCHTTGKGRVKSLTTEGVGCEACHGPGSHYHEPSVHVNYLDRKKGYQQAVKFGMYPILGDQLKNREKLCLNCHAKPRPCAPTTMKEIQNQQMTIQLIDKLRKGDLNFKHPLRR